MTVAEKLVVELLVYVSAELELTVPPVEVLVGKVLCRVDVTVVWIVEVEVDVTVVELYVNDSCQTALWLPLPEPV